MGLVFAPNTFDGNINALNHLSTLVVVVVLVNMVCCDVFSVLVFPFNGEMAPVVVPAPPSLSMPFGWSYIQC